MKQLIVFALVVSLSLNAQAQSERDPSSTKGDRPLCTGSSANKQAGAIVEKMTGGYNPDKLDRVKSDGIRETICAGDGRDSKNDGSKGKAGEGKNEGSGSKGNGEHRERDPGRKD